MIFQMWDKHFSGKTPLSREKRTGKSHSRSEREFSAVGKKGDPFSLRYKSHPSSRRANQRSSSLQSRPDKSGADAVFIGGSFWLRHELPDHAVEIGVFQPKLKVSSGNRRRKSRTGRARNFARVPGDEKLGISISPMKSIILQESLPEQPPTTPSRSANETRSNRVRHSFQGHAEMSQVWRQIEHIPSGSNTQSSSAWNSSQDAQIETRPQMT